MTIDLNPQPPRVTRLPTRGTLVAQGERTSRFPPPSERYRVPDDLWLQIRPVIVRLDPPKQLGRKRVDPRAALDAIIYRMLTRCPWNRLPSSFPDDSAIHRTYQRWRAAGVLNEIWTILLSERRQNGGPAERDCGSPQRSQAG